MRHSGWVLAYHGCDKTVGERILAGKAEVTASRNEHDWLGTGAYFWEHSFSRALRWAEFLRDHPKYSRRPIRRPFVIGAIIDPGNCLDLTEGECLDVLKVAADEFIAFSNAAGNSLPKNEPGFSGDEDLVKRKLDCAIINALHLFREETGQSSFHTVRCPFLEGGPLFEGARIFSRTHVQWCVRDPRKNVFAYFRPRLPVRGGP